MMVCSVGGELLDLVLCGCVQVFHPVHEPVE